MFVQRWKSYPKWINHPENSDPNIRANRADLGQTATKRAVWSVSTLMCLSIGTPKAINFPFVSKEKLMFFRCPNIQAHYNEAVIYLNFGTPKNNEFSIWNKWKIYHF